MTGQRDRRGANPTPRPSLTIGEGPHSARLTEIADGVRVTFCFADRVPESETFTEPMHLIADRVHDLITQANKGI